MTRRKNSLCVLVLAAGKGTRMCSGMPKVLHRILEEPMLYYPLKAASGAGVSDTGVVIGFGGEEVERWLAAEFPETKTIWQREQLGTGHAVKLAQEWWKNYSHVMILPGDTPLITSETLQKLMQRHIENESECSVLSFDIEDPSGYGRIIRYGSGVRIVEQKDATTDEAKCREVNSGIYVFATSALAGVIDGLSCENNQKEYYLPDTLKLISDRGGKSDVVKAEGFSEFLGINDAKQLAEAADVMRSRILDELMLRGVKCMDPRTTWIGPKVEIGADVTIEPNVQIWGSSRVGSRSLVGSFSVLRNAKIAEGVTIAGSVRINDSTVGSGVQIGPFAFIRENAIIEVRARIGRFVEVKKSVIAEGAKVPHLSYIGDARVGKKSNIGAGTITCNFDGEKKNTTIVGENCFIGSATMLVAPVELGDGCTTGAGSVITVDVPEGALAISRARQKNIKNWRLRNRSNRSEKDGGEEDVGRNERG